MVLVRDDILNHRMSLDVLQPWKGERAGFLDVLEAHKLNRQIPLFGATWHWSMHMGRRAMAGDGWVKWDFEEVQAVQVLNWSKLMALPWEAPEQASQALNEALRLNATHPAVARNAQALSGGPQDGSGSCDSQRITWRRSTNSWYQNTTHFTMSASPSQCGAHVGNATEQCQRFSTIWISNRIGIVVIHSNPIKISVNTNN